MARKRPNVCGKNPTTCSSYVGADWGATRTTPCDHWVPMQPSTASWLEEYCRGATLDTFINAAIYQDRNQQLFTKLTALAYFLATLHNRTANGHGVDFTEDCAYLDRLVNKLESEEIIRVWDAEELYWLRDLWRQKPRVWEDRQVLAYGDATPSNFLFGDDLNVIAIDLERTKRADRVFDLGRIAGELQHSYMQATGNKYAAEPFISHFLWEYA